MILPNEGTVAWEKEVLFYRHATPRQVRERAADYGILTDSYRRNMLRRGIFRFASFRDPVPAFENKAQPDEKIIEASTGLTALEKEVLDFILKDQNVTVGAISRSVNRPWGISSETVIKLIDSLRSKHYEINLDTASRQVYVPHAMSRHFEPSDFKYYHDRIRIGIVSDTHIGSKYQQMTLLHDAYKIFDDKEVDFIVHAGDVFDGFNHYRGHLQELFLTDAKEQLDYAVKYYPKSKRDGIKTYVIGGQHDECFKKQNGYNIVEHLCEKREDLVYRGFYSTNFKIKEQVVSLYHAGGGVSYARSYRVQKIVEGLVGHILPEIRKDASKINLIPTLIAFGHWHVAFHLPNYMGTDAVAVPCLQTQTTYLQQKGLSPDIGCAVADVYMNQDNQLGATRVEFINMSGQTKENNY